MGFFLTSSSSSDEEDRSVLFLLGPKGQLEWLDRKLISAFKTNKHKGNFYRVNNSMKTQQALTE